VCVIKWFSDVAQGGKRQADVISNEERDLLLVIMAEKVAYALALRTRIVHETELDAAVMIFFVELHVAL
jgi:hypothetical protein